MVMGNGFLFDRDALLIHRKTDCMDGLGSDFGTDCSVWIVGSVGSFTLSALSRGVS